MAGSLHGKNVVAGERSAVNAPTICARNPESGEDLRPEFSEAHPEEIDRACLAAQRAYAADRKRPAAERAALLEAMADEIDALGSELVECVGRETGLPHARIRGERTRTINQLRMFADLVREGSWVDARIDRARPEREPSPKPDIRRMLIALGPVAVFGASNFPLAFSVAGGDTASALAAGCPVIVKAHPAHPGTSEMVAEAVTRAVPRAGFHAGTFSLLHGAEPDVSIALVEHPSIRAVGFTGSLRAGRAIYDAAAARPEPIPVFAEMGSVNPVFVLPGALKERAAAIAEGLAGSVTLGGGQFCTNPGVVVGLDSEDFNSFRADAGGKVAATPTCTLLHHGIQRGFDEGMEAVVDCQGVSIMSRASTNGSTATPAAAAVLTVSGADFLRQSRLQQEVFGPSTLLVCCASREEMMAIAHHLEGNLTATIHGSDDDLENFAGLVTVLEDKVGRLIFNGFPTGVEVCASMHHGGPYPATTDARSTSVGTAAILRFARPIAYQDFPDAALPAELRDRNERGIWRLVDGSFTRDDVSPR